MKNCSGFCLNSAETEHNSRVLTIPYWGHILVSWVRVCYCRDLTGMLTTFKARGKKKKLALDLNLACERMSEVTQTCLGNLKLPLHFKNLCEILNYVTSPKDRVSKRLQRWRVFTKAAMAQ